MKHLKLVVLLLFISSIVFAQVPNSEQVISNQSSNLIAEQSEEISFSMFNKNQNYIMPNDEHNTEVKIENYLQQKGIKSKYKREDSPVPIDVISGDQFLDAGVISISQLNSIGFGTFSNKNDGNDNGSTGTSSVNLRGGANIIRGLGVRAMVLINNQTYKPEQGDNKFKDRNSLVGLEVVKPLVLGNHAVNVYAGFSSGAIKEIDEVGGSEFENETNLTVYGAGIEMPISLGGSAAYFTPMLSYVFENGDYDNGEYDYNSLQIRGGMYSFFTCAMFDPCGKNGSALGDGQYGAGSSCLGSDCGFNLEIGNETDKYSSYGYSGESKTKNTHTGLQFDYGYYVIDGLAARALFNYAGETIKDDENSDLKWTGTHITYGLGAIYNLPLEGKLQHLFVKGDFMVGTDKDKQEDGVNPDIEQTHDLTNINLGVGYNLFFVPGVAFTPTIGYSLNNTQNSFDQDINGLSVNLGITNYINDWF